MYSVIVTMTVQEAQREAFEQLMRELASEVRANEPEALCYHVLRCRGEPPRYRVVEIYRSKEAFKAHLGAAHVLKANVRVRAALVGSPEFEVTEIVS